MIVCNGCSKSGTHFLTSLMAAMGKTQLGGTLIKRPSRPLFVTSKRKLSSLFEEDNDHYIHSHLIHSPSLAEKLAGHRHVFILRNPRNIAISWMRHRIKQDPSLEASEALLMKIVLGGMFGRPVSEFISLHLPWVQEDDVCCVRFEDLIARDQGALDGIAAHVGAQADPAHYDAAFGKGATFTGSFSDSWDNPHWTDAVEQTWVAAGGPAVEAAAGYT